MDILFFILIIYYAACYKKVPPGKEAVVRRNREIYRTYRAGQTFFINPFTDTVEMISLRGSNNTSSSSAYPKVNYINPMNSSSSTSSRQSTSNGSRVYTINNSYSFTSADGKYLSVKIYALFKALSHTTVPISSLEVSLKKEVINYFTMLKAEEISNNATKHELTLFDILRRTLSNNSIKLEKFEATPSNSRITTRNTLDKTECTHYDDIPTTRKKSNYSYSDGNAIKSSFTDTLQELNGNPISDSDSNQDDPIKETLSISSLFGTDMIDVNNMDSNVDPIDNKI